jgi:hypothetical protein
VGRIRKQKQRDAFHLFPNRGREFFERAARFKTLLRLVPLGFALAIAPLCFNGCVSAYKETVGGETEQVFTRIYLTDFNTAWQSVLEGMKHNRLDISNREAGYVQTKWTDNTEEMNLADSYSGTDSYLKAQYRFRVNVGKGFYNGKPSVKVTVQREQLVQRDVLEGWRPIETDSVEENTLLYRIGRIIFMKMKIAKLEEQKTQEQIENTKF